MLDHPFNSHMRSQSDRLASFKQNFPRLRATPEQFASAGFFYLGKRDRVKCWYCNGGLQFWKYDDDPWTEHAKWYPSCEFLLQEKGSNFVMSVTERFPNLSPVTLQENSSRSAGEVLLSIPKHSEEMSGQVSLEDRIKVLDDQRKCKICFESDANTVFTPCGHLCCCTICAKRFRKCPICRQVINSVIRAFLS